MELHEKWFFPSLPPYSVDLTKCHLKFFVSDMKTLEIFINTNWKQPKLKAVYATNAYFDKFLLSTQWYL